MIKLTLFLGAVLAIAPGISSAKDYPLEFKTLTAQEAMSFPGSAGIYAQIDANKPSSIAKEPAAVSKHPLYGESGDGAGKIVFRLDETQGDGKGYDQLIMDLNGNRDLTDDPVIAVVVEKNATPSSASSRRILFGPIPAPEGKKISGGQPVCFAQFYLFSMPSGMQVDRAFQGQLRIKPGWYLETTAEFDGVKRKVGLVDGNCNYRLCDISTPTTYNSDGQTNWYFRNGDTFLQDADDSGEFGYSSANPENFPFFPMIYVGSKPYKIALSADSKLLAVEPWSEPLAELSIQPQGKQMASIQVALENASGQWQLLQVNVTDGKTRVPPGNCRLYACTIKDKTKTGDALILSGRKSVVEEGVKCPVGAATPFKCGAPIEVKVSSRRDSNSGFVVGESNTLLGRLLRSATQPKEKEPLQQRIEARLVGAGGEMYSSFDLVSKDGNINKPAEPTFAITDAEGKKVADGKMEFG